MPNREYSLGIDPDNLDVHLSQDSDFVASLRKRPEQVRDQLSWPDGTVFELRFARDNQVWATELSDNKVEVVWNVDKVATNTRRQGERVSLWYVNGSSEQRWASGKVVRHDR